MLGLSVTPDFGLQLGASGNLPFDKLAHVGMYGLQAYLLMNSFYRMGWQHPSPAAAIGVLFGLLMEAVQGLFLPYRSAEWLDLLANVAGTGAGIVLYIFVYSLKP